MISVCLATRNGSRYVGEQLTSILPQLSVDDEVIISDDASTDDTLGIVRSLDDSRVKILQHKHAIGIVSNFEAALKQSSGDVIFLADQDDVWLPGKVEITLSYLRHFDLVLSDCEFVDDRLHPIHSPEDKKLKTQKGIVKNLIRNSYMGCCMAFRRSVIEKALPFPPDIPMHDIWIGLVAEMYFNVSVIPDKLVLHRRHAHNASTTGMSSRLTLGRQLVNRYKIVKNLILHQRYAV
ncbi:MAG TPA: glycosyltransferase family 2 protein [Chryseosolibacter sp.]